MASITEQGFFATSLAEYLEERRFGWLSAFGEDLNTDDDTPQGQIIGTEALLLTQMDEVLEDTASALDISQASGIQLDNLCSILAILRKDAINSNVNAAMTGAPLTVVPVGSQARLTTGEVFTLKEAVSLDSSGDGVGFFEAVDEGAIAVPVSTLTSIVTAVPGWETVNNAAQGATGVVRETDFTYKRRYFLELAVNAVTPLDSIIAGVFTLDGVVDVTGVENDTDTSATIEGVSVAPHSVAMAVDGGSDSEVAEEIRRRKTLGTGTVGDTTVSVPVYKFGTSQVIQELDIKFYRVADVAITLDIEIQVGASFPPDGEQRIKDALLLYFNGTAKYEPEFEYNGLQISEDVYRSRLYTPVNSVPGHIITSLVMQSTPALEVVVVNLNQVARISEDDITITTT